MIFLISMVDDEVSQPDSSKMYSLEGANQVWRVLDQEVIEDQVRSV